VSLYDYLYIYSFVIFPSQKPEAIALYDFTPQAGEEVGFTKGTRIKVLEEIDQNWWKGECNGQVGLFPAAYVKLK
jgi:hypothetical protein